MTIVMEVAAPNRDWLADALAAVNVPIRIHGIYDNDGGGVPDDVKNEIRSAADAAPLARAATL